MGKGRLPAPLCCSEGSLALPISFKRGWLHALLPGEGDDVFLCLLLCQYGTINFVPPLFQNIHSLEIYIYIYIHTYTHSYFYIFGNSAEDII